MGREAENDLHLGGDAETKRHGAGEEERLLHPCPDELNSAGITLSNRTSAPLKMGEVKLSLFSCRAE